MINILIIQLFTSLKALIEYKIWKLSNRTVKLDCSTATLVVTSIANMCFLKRIYRLTRKKILTFIKKKYTTMKKKLLLTGMLFALIPSTFIAQIALNSTEMLPFGSVMTLSVAQDHSIVDTVTQGQGVTWNLTGLTKNTTSSDLVVEIVNPSNTPHGGSFPTSNYAYSENSGTAYRYFDLSSTKMERVGSFSNGTLKTYSDPQVEYVFPFAYGVQNNDIWNNSASSSGGTYDLKCIGTGTLNLPGGSYQAILVRVNTVESFIDYDVYFWYDADNGAVLLQYIIGDGFYVGTGARFATNITLGNKEFEALENLKYTNPVVNEFKMSFDNNLKGNLVYSIIDLRGRKVYQGVPDQLNGKVQIEYDFRTLDKGMYIVTVLDEDSGETLKSIKIVKQ